MSYAVTIRVIGPSSENCRTPFPDEVACRRMAYYTVGIQYDPPHGGPAGSNVCAQHLFATIGYFLGLPEPDAPRSAP